MIVDESFVPWTREHDKPGAPRFGQVPRVLYPTELADLIAICKDPGFGPRLRAVGSHWALSEAAFSDHTFVETHDRDELRTAMGATLDEVVPRCLHPDFVDVLANRLDGPSRIYPVHVEAGKRIYQLYSELDRPTDGEGSLGLLLAQRGRTDYGGPWAPATLGGAGGQTIVGALNTGTHGGDFDRPPVQDSVLALHLVLDGGRHWWIEPEPTGETPQLTEDAALRSVYERRGVGDGEASLFEIKRDTELFDAVLVSCGRFGIIYSVVLKAAPQHLLQERRRLHVWQDVRNRITARDPGLFDDAAEPGEPNPPKQRFLQIAVCLTPHLGFLRNLVGVTKRWERPLPPGVEPTGRSQRRGGIERDHDPILKAPRFEKAGRGHGLTSDPEKDFGSDPGFLEVACRNTSFLAGVIDAVIAQVEEWIESGNATPVVAAVAVAGGAGLILLAAALLALLAVLKEILEELSNDTLGHAMDRLRQELLEKPLDPMGKAAGLFLWQAIAYKIFESMQGDDDLTGVSYAVMDRKNYLQPSCEVNVDSVEVFFDAADSRLVAFVDALIAFEIQQEIQGKAFLGYASLRFTGPTRALIGEQKHATTCAIEIACLRDMTGSQEVVDYATALALNPNFGAKLHWGQKNPATREQIERMYGEDLHRWRAALATVTNGDDRFTSDFTRRTGLEPV